MLVATASSLVPATEASAAPPGFVASGKMGQRFAAVYMGTQPSTLTEAQAVDIATRFDVLATDNRSFAGFVPAMKAANPRLRLLSYANASFVATQFGPTTGSFPTTLYARDAAGNFIQSRNFGSWLMQVQTPEWKDVAVEHCKRYLQNPGFDGCFLDMLGAAPVISNYTTSKPINPATGSVWTRAEWMGEMARTGEYVQSKLPEALVAGNGLSWGLHYLDPTGPTSTLWSGINGGMAELFVRLSTDAVTTYRSEVDWKKDVDMLVDAGKRGESVLAVTKLWVTATPAQRDAWQRYAFATFLLGTNGQQYLSFSDAKTWEALTADAPIERADVGVPTTSYALMGTTRVYQRKFTKGMALVNPSGSSYRVSLGGRYHRAGTTGSFKSITVAPHSGEILLAG